MSILPRQEAHPRLCRSERETGTAFHERNPSATPAVQPALSAGSMYTPVLANFLFDDRSIGINERRRF